MVSAVLSRGDGQSVKEYSTGIHQDYGLGPDNYCTTLEAYYKPLVDAWRAKHDNPECKRSMVICFWRPIHMKGPVKANPLALCDRKSVNINDQVHVHLYGFAPTGKHIVNLNLKYNPDHKWFYYPDMTNDETIVFI
jgi:hypothetical protein